MKKRLATIVSALALVAVMLVGLCACGSTYGSIKSAYEKAGYAESESVSDAQKEIVSTFLGEDAETAVTIHVLTKKGFSMHLKLASSSNSNPPKRWKNS